MAGLLSEGPLENPGSMAGQRLAMGVSFKGSAYRGWQSQRDGQTVQDTLETALSRFAAVRVSTVCAGRTDAGVHAVQQVVHLDAPVSRAPASWVRGTNAHLPDDIAVQWCVPVGPGFHARNSAKGRRYAYILRASPVRPSLESGQVGWVFRPLSLPALEEAAALLVGEHDFSAFRSSQCQSPSPVKHLRELKVARLGAYWRFDFEANAFLHHMIRNLMGSLLAVGTGTRPVSWLAQVLAARERSRAAPTFSPAGLYFLGPHYDAVWGVPQANAASGWLPGASA